MSEIYGVFGVGGFGREVMPLARAQLKRKKINLQKLYFVVDKPEREEVNGVRVISFNEFVELPDANKFLSIAVSDGKIRENLHDRNLHFGVYDWPICSENSIIMDNVEIAQSSIICPFVTITSNVTIGIHFHANLYSYVAHDCVIGHFVTFAPGVKCNGNIVIEDHVYVGAGAIIKQGSCGSSPLIIGQGAVIGMGAVVTKNVPANVTVIGNPARIYKHNDNP